jgi:glycosyltransferase involved in cell wall biosynthesis
MRVLLLGDTSPVLDEGAKNVANYLVRFLERRHDVMQVHQRAAVRPSSLARSIRFKPDVLMSVQGPSARTIGLLAFLRLFCGGPRTLVVGAQPSSGRALKWSIRALPPHCLFVQSRRWIDRFRGAGVPLRRLPNGVNMDKFRPADDPSAVAALRAELGLRADAKVALHVGPLNRNRNYELLVRLQRETDWQVLVVGSTTAPYVPEVERALQESGVCVVRRYLPELHLVYAAADAYVFPVVDPGGSIEFPLTVLEAMACDRPVVTTRFLALPEYLDEGDAFAYFDGSLPGLTAALERVHGRGGNRQRAGAFSWDRIVADVEAEFVSGEKS